MRSTRTAKLEAAQARVRLAGLIDSGAARSARLRAGMPVGELAKLLEVDYSSIWRWEVAKGRPRDLRVVHAWLDVLDALMGDTDDLEDVPAAAGA